MWLNCVLTREEEHPNIIDTPWPKVTAEHAKRMWFKKNERMQHFDIQMWRGGVWDELVERKTCERQIIVGEHIKWDLWHWPGQAIKQNKTKKKKTHNEKERKKNLNAYATAADIIELRRERGWEYSVTDASNKLPGSWGWLKGNEEMNGKKRIRW